MNTNPNDFVMLTDIQVAERLGISVSTVRRWRLMNGQGPRWRRVGGASIRYHVSDVEAYLENAPSGGGLPQEAR